MKTFAFSKASVDKLAFLEQPTPTRKPVGYQSSLLAAYDPERALYLGQEEAQRLSAIGRMSAATAGDGWQVDVALASARLEGCAYTEEEAWALFHHHQFADQHSVTDTFLLLNHLEALRFLDQLEPDEAISPGTILNLHALLAYQLLPPRLETQAGRLRTQPVLIGHSTYTPPSRDTALEPHFKHLLTLATAIPTAVEAAFFLLVHLSYLQPFIDANKRTARMAANIPLLRHHMVPLSFAGVDASSYNKAMLLFYETLDMEPLRDIFVWAYEQSCQRYQST